YVVPTGKDNFIVSAGRPNMVPAGRTIVSPGSIIFGPGVTTVVTSKFSLSTISSIKVRSGLPGKAAVAASYSSPFLNLSIT
ncbi:hypothetical protein Tco_1536262, partial [Tanacetum coccineum]